jgi:phage N-6-adenine-methyltransferase
LRLRNIILEVKAMNKALLSSKKMDWRTPQAFFDDLNREFHFVLDAAAMPENAKCTQYFTPETDGLSRSWDVGGSVFCNPPYGRKIGQWVQKAYSEYVRGAVTIVMLIPARTDTSYFHDYIYGKAEIRFLRGRLKFEDENGAAMNPAPFPSMVVIFR